MDCCIPTVITNLAIEYFIKELDNLLTEPEKNKILIWYHFAVINIVANHGDRSAKKGLIKYKMNGVLDIIAKDRTGVIKLIDNDTYLLDEENYLLYLDHVVVFEKEYSFDKLSEIYNWLKQFKLFNKKFDILYKNREKIMISPPTYEESMKNLLIPTAPLLDTFKE